MTKKDPLVPVPVLYVNPVDCAQLTGPFGYHIRPDCRLCYGPLTRVLDLPDTCLANEYPEQPGHQDKFPLFLSRCDHCGHVQLPVVVNPERLFRNYAYQSGTSPVFRRHLREFAYDTAPPDSMGDDDHPKLIVDIASNDGTLLEGYREHGVFRLLGVDPARNLAAQALEKGIDTITEFFTPSLAREIVKTHGAAHLITALNVCAHVDDLNGFMAGVAELLHDDGTFVLEVGYLPDVIERGLYRVCYHEHLDYHHLAPLVGLLGRHGLTITHAERVDSQGGSLRVFASKRGVPNRFVYALLESETPEALNVQRLVTRMGQDGFKLHKAIKSLRLGQTVCGYGAPAQLTTTCYALGIMRDDIAFIVDDNPLKQGRFTPGRHIPILPPSALYERKPDACVIFSANFSEDIRARHREYRGEWIEI